MDSVSAIGSAINGVLGQSNGVSQNQASEANQKFSDLLNQMISQMTQQQLQEFNNSDDEDDG